MLSGVFGTDSGWSTPFAPILVRPGVDAKLFCLFFVLVTFVGAFRSCSTSRDLPSPTPPVSRRIPVLTGGTNFYSTGISTPLQLIFLSGQDLCQALAEVGWASYAGDASRGLVPTVAFCYCTLCPAGIWIPNSPITRPGQCSELENSVA
jgi:hypothetical protein